MSRKTWRLFSLLVFTISGIILLSYQASPRSETLTRQEIVRQAFSPNDFQSTLIHNDLAPTTGDVVVPITVNLADVPHTVENPTSLYNRWLRGEIDLDKEEGILDEVEIARLQAEARNRPPDDNIQIAQPGPGRAPTLGISGDSMDYGDSGGFVPPDLELAVGPHHIIAVVNTSFEIYDKTLFTITPATSFTSFMSGTVCASGVFDPNVLYDEAMDRYILAIDQRTTSPADSNYCIAVSQTSDPTGSWYIYEFSTLVSGNWMDYPHAGVGNDAIYMGGNMFTFGGSFVEGRIWAFPKARMYAGLPASSVTRLLGTNQDTPQPLNLHGFNQGTWPSSGPHYIFSETNYNGNNHTLYSWSDPFNGSSGTLTTVGAINLGVVSYPVQSPQSGGSNLSGNDWRPLDFEYRNGYGWTTMTVGCNPGAGTVNCIRWAQIDLTTATLGPQGSGIYSSDGDYRSFPDLAVNHCDDMAVGYTKSNSSMFPAIWVNGRQSGDTPGTLQTETQLKAGDTTYSAFDGAPFRWGDYTGMTIDPDGETFWYLGEYSKSIAGAANWGSYIGSFSYPCTVDDLPDADAYHRDLDAPHVTSPGDIGIEPDPLAGPMWVSQDIWVRLADDGSTVHENPEFGQVNYVYARLRNSGPNAGPADITGRVYLYWAYAATGLSWPSDWNLIGIAPVPDLAAGGSINVSVPWDPPGTGHYCLLARWISDQDPITFAEGSNINTNVRNNNNLAWRNVNVVNLISSPEGGDDPVVATGLVRNTKPADAEVNLHILPLPDDPDPFLAHGQLFIDLGPLFDGWGGEGVGIEPVGGTVLEIKDPQLASIDGILMGPDEAVPIQMMFQPFPGQQRGQYMVGLWQFDAEEPTIPVGGIHYEINMQNPALPPEPPDIKITPEGDDLRLTWLDDNVNLGGFEIWRHNMPHLDPGDAGTTWMASPAYGTTEHLIPDGLVETSSHHFYLMVAYNINGEAINSHEVGTFVYGINTSVISPYAVPEY